MNQLKETLSQYWLTIQGTLFPWLKEELGDLTDKQQLLITVLEIIRLEEHLPSNYCLPGRPLSDRVAIARAFVAKAIYDMPTTRILLDRLACDIVLSLKWVGRTRIRFQVNLPFPAPLPNLPRASFPRRYLRL